jgi:hypothetical protein
MSDFAPFTFENKWNDYCAVRDNSSISFTPFTLEEGKKKWSTYEEFVIQGMKNSNDVKLVSSNPLEFSTLTSITSKEEEFENSNKFITFKFPS